MVKGLDDPQVHRGRDYSRASLKARDFIADGKCL